MRPLLILRPEPGATATAVRAREIGLQAIVCPLFAVRPVDWEMPEPGQFDALLLTSANAVRLAGETLATLTDLPVFAVGGATAAEATNAGFQVVGVGEAGVDRLLAGIPTSQRLLHLCGRNTANPAPTTHDVTRRIVYVSEALPTPVLPIDGTVVAVHSPRAGRRLSELVREERREAARLCAISPAAAAACGAGWEMVEASTQPTDAALLALAARLCHMSA